MKEKALTRGGLGIDLFSMSREVSRGRISCMKRATKEMWMTHRGDEGLNIKMFQIR